MSGETGTGRVLVIQRDVSPVGLQQGQYQPYQRTLPAAGLPEHGGQAPRLEIVCEMFQHLTSAAGIGKSNILHTDTSLATQDDRLALFLQRHGVELVYPLHGSQCADKHRNLPGQLHDRALYLRHQLQEGGQRAECYRTGVQPVYSPCESGHIAEGEPRLHHDT